MPELWKHFNLTPKFIDFQCEDQATSAVANELLSLAQKHNSMTQDEDACLAHLLQMHKEPYGRDFEQIRNIQEGGLRKI